MKIEVLFFGATADIVGTRRMLLENTECISSSLIDKIISLYPKLKAQKLLFSINQRYAAGDEIVQDGDEIAIFTAVSGG